MSLRAIIWAQSFVVCDAKSKAVLSAIARSATVPGRPRFLSCACLERRTGLMERSVRRAVSYLEREGLISRRIQNGRQGVNSYAVIGAPAWVWNHELPIPKESGTDDDQDQDQDQDENPAAQAGDSSYKPGLIDRTGVYKTGNAVPQTGNAVPQTGNPVHMADRGSMESMGGSEGGSHACGYDADPPTSAEVAPRWALRSPAGAGGFAASDPARPWRYDPVTEATSWERVCRSHGLATFNGMAEEWAELVQVSEAQTWGEAGEALALFAHLFQKESGPQSKQIRPGQVGGFVSEVRKRINTKRRQSAMIAAALPRREAAPAHEVRAAPAPAPETPEQVEEREAAHASPLGREWAQAVATLIRTARGDDDAKSINLWLASRKVYPLDFDGQTVRLRVPTVLFAHTIRERFAARLAALTGWAFDFITPESRPVEAAPC